MRKLLCGLMIGVSYVIPGVCSVSTAKALNQYENMLEMYSKFYVRKVLFKNIFLLIGIFLGIFLGFFLLIILDNYAWILLTIFLSINILQLKIKIKSICDFLFILLGLLVVMLFSINFNVDNNNQLIFFIISGIFVALGFVLPGLSGSLLMLNMGIYNYIVDLFKYKNLFNTNLLMFVLSLLIFIFIWSKLISQSWNKANNKTVKFVDGMLFGSIILMIKNLVNEIDSQQQCITCILIVITVTIIVTSIKTLNNYLMKSK